MLFFDLELIDPIVASTRLSASLMTPAFKRVSQTGFYFKSSNHVYTQRIAIHNTKSTALKPLKIVDQTPVSEDSQITVTLHNPDFRDNSVETGPGSTLKSRNFPALRDRNSAKSTARALTPFHVNVSNGVVAFWSGTDESGGGFEALGKDGKFDWSCSVPAQGKVNLVLHWEVKTPLKAKIVEL